jgi:hypothetical protein
MKKIDLGQKISILANIGVVVGIVALIFELDQNSDAIRLQARAVLLATRAEDQRTLATNAGGLADLYEKARAGEELTSAESWRLVVDRSNAIHTFEALYREVVEGNLSEDDIPLLQWRGAYQDSFGLDRFFENTKDNYNPAFVDYFERNVVQRATVR